MQKWIDTIHFTIIACLGGCVSYVSNTSTFTFREFFIKGLSSGFTGYLIYQLCDYNSLPSNMTGFLCGTFGYLGSDATILILKKYLQKYLPKNN